MDLNVPARNLDPTLQFVGEHHLRQFALGVGIPGGVFLVKVKVFELNVLQPHFIGVAANDHDAPSRLFDSFEEQSTQEKKPGQAIYAGIFPVYMLRAYVLHPRSDPEVAMPRIPRLLVSEIPTVYHVISRTVLPGLPFKAPDKDRLQSLILHFSQIYFTEILGFCLMDNHFHLLVRMFPKDHGDEASLRERFRLAYGDKVVFPHATIEKYRRKWSSLSEFIKEIKQSFSRYYNKQNGRKGYLWGDRFKSVIVQDGRTLVNCLAYIDLNPVRANIVNRPEDYRWSSLGYHAQTGNRAGFLSLDLGMAEWGIGIRARLQKYREFVYETGALDAGKGARLDPTLVKGERKKGYRLTAADRFRYRTRYFTDSGVIGTREFVARHSKKFHEYFACKNEKKPKKIDGLDQIFSLKRLSGI